MLERVSTLVRLGTPLVRRVWIPLLLVSLLSTWLPSSTSRAQAVSVPPATVKAPHELFRVDVTEISGGAELITIHARWEGLNASNDRKWIPNLSILRDTLGDHSTENDRLRYLWPLTYTSPTMRQRISGAIPFLYSRVGNKKSSSQGPPPAAMDLAEANREVWEKLLWTALQNVLLDPYGAPVKASTRSYRRNVSDYRKSQIVKAFSVLSLYQSVSGSPVFSESELAQINARLLLTDKTFGGLVDELNLERYYQKDLVQARDERGHNWELLRQRAEAESLYFEPLRMPDGSMTHALLWVSKSDLEAKRNQPFDKRFLNITSPWKDKRLLDWKGFVEVRYFDQESRGVPADTPGAHMVEMIPLALYGLDNPKIPMLLVDFRDGLNPKKREMSRRLLQDVTRDVLSISRFGDVSYFLGRTVLDLVTGRRGMDINQPSRLRIYSQLKLLLALNESLAPELRTEITSKLEKVSLNPLENDLDAEARLAEQQYAALLAYAKRPDGLQAQLARDRQKEMVPLEHGGAERFLFRLANILTFGKYVHREKDTGEMESRLDIARRLTYHTNFLRKVARSGPKIDVKWNVADVQRSLLFIAEHGSEVESRTISAVVRIFEQTSDEDTRRACIDSLSRIERPKARVELARISEKSDLEPTLKALITHYLTMPHPLREPLTSDYKGNDQRSGGQQ